MAELITSSGKMKTMCLTGLFLAWAVGYADRILMSTAIIPISHEFGLSIREAGAVLSAFYVSYAFMQLAGGWLSDRFGSRIVIVMCIVAWSFFTGATSIAWSFTSLLVIRFIFGMGEGGFAPASSVTVAEVFPKKERARAKSFLLSTTFLGNAAGSGLVALTVMRLGWRSAFEILAMVGSILAISLWWILKANQSGNARKRNVSAVSHWRALLSNPMSLKLTLIWCCMSILYTGMQSWMPTYLVKAYHIDLFRLSIAVALPNLLAFAGTNLVGMLLDRSGRKHERVFMVSGSVVCVLSIAVLSLTANIWLLLACWTTFFLAFNFVYVTIFSVPLKHFDEHLIGSASGFINFGGQLGGMLAPVTMGALIAAFGGSFMTAFIFLISVGVLSALISLSWKARDHTSGFLNALPNEQPDYLMRK